MIFINMNLRKIIKEEVNDFEDLNWIDKISDKWVPKPGDKFICKPGFKRLSDYDYHPDRYGGAAYIPGKVYTIDHIGPHYDDDHMVLFTVEDENNNGVFKKAAEPYFDYLEESTSDFGWAEGDVTYTIDFILGMKCTYRKNNLSELEIEYNLSMSDLNRGDVELGELKNKESYWWITRVEGDKVVITLMNGDELNDYTIEEVEQYVNLGIWVLLDERGNILNDFSR